MPWSCVVAVLDLLLLVEPCEDSRRLLAFGGEFLAPVLSLVWLLFCPCPKPLWFGPWMGLGQRCQPQLGDARGEPLWHIPGMGTEFHGWGRSPWLQ